MDKKTEEANAILKYIRGVDGEISFDTSHKNIIRFSIEGIGEPCDVHVKDSKGAAFRKLARHIYFGHGVEIGNAKWLAIADQMNCYAETQWSRAIAEQIQDYIKNEQIPKGEIMNVASELMDAALLCNFRKDNPALED